VSNVVTVTPSASQSAACGTAICSGGDAEVKVVLAQGGVPLVGREVRFDVVSGDIRVITSPPGVDEVDSLSGSTTTDATGTARIRIRVLANATSQTAILQITDVSSGFTQTTSATIAASTNAPLTAVPNVVRFTGPDGSSCASGIGADVIVSGGRPPYQIAQTAAFIISPTTVTQSGGTFTVKSTGQCAEEGLVIGTGGTAIAIVDASGGSTSVTAINNPAPATPTSSFIVSPTSVTLDSCDAVATFNLIGGTGSYSFASGSNGLAVKKISASQMTIGRTNTVPTRTTITSTPITVSFTDGKSAIPVVVNLVGAAIGTCPP
jgi:hypothetical protein